MEEKDILKAADLFEKVGDAEALEFMKEKNPDDQFIITLLNIQKRIGKLSGQEVYDEFIDALYKQYGI